MEVWIDAGKAASGGNVLGESGMDAMILVGEGGERLDVGAEEFASFAVAFDFCNYRVSAVEFGEFF